MKILLIDHPYRKKTNSIGFLGRLLEKRFEVTTYYETTNHVDYGNDLDSFDAVALFQVGVGDINRRLRHRNIIFFPMYDNIGLGDEYTWKSIGDTKVISFCRRLFDEVRSFGGRALYSQYYPEAGSIIEGTGSGGGLFFWQRTEAIGWPQVKLLLGNHQVPSVHIHRATDPGCPFSAPTAVEDISYNIRYSDWFSTRAGFLAVLNENRYFIAPRVSEGIGMSFLEAMAMGKIVIAANRPTMNEYITDGVSGLLFDPDSPTMMDFSRAAVVEKNVLDSVSDGQARWKRHQDEILDFMMPEKTLRRQSSRRIPLALRARASLVAAKKLLRMLGPHGLVLALERRRASK
jgi:hypothetical protein